MQYVIAKWVKSVIMKIIPIGRAKYGRHSHKFFKYRSSTNCR